MKKKIAINVVFILVAVIVISAAIGYSIWNKPHQNIKDADALKISAAELYSSLANNGDHQNSSYINKVVLISGEVKEILKNQSGEQVILLKTAVDGGYVNCTMEDGTSNISVGNMVSLKGICSGYNEGDKDLDLPGDVFLIRCYLLT